jgi:hypothetical protein
LFVGAMSPKELSEQLTHGDFCFGPAPQPSPDDKTGR